MIRRIETDYGIIEYELEIKKVKNINLRVRPDMTVHVSANRRTSTRTIDDFVRSKAEMITTAIAEMREKNKKLPQQAGIENGCVMNIFGSPFALCVDAGNKNCVTVDGSRLHLTVTDPCDSELKKKVLRTYLESVCRNVVENMCHDFHKAYFEPLGISFPALKFRLMKSRWGSCQPQNGVLTFNYALLNVPDDCVFYVVAHEFTHFLHPDHSKRFYAQLEKYVPDWKEKRERMKYCSTSLL